MTQANLEAFLRVIREGESTQRDDAYTLLNGGTHFAGFADHPYAGQSAPPGLAAGAYQFIPHTWERVAKAIGATSFSPEWQDRGAIALIEMCGALPAVEAGDLDTACKLLASTWVSLPSLGQTRIESVFKRYGGTLAEEAPAAAPSETGGFMGAIAAFLPLIVEMIPQLIGIFGKGARAETNAKAAQLVADTFVKAVPGAVNLQDAVEKAQADPAVATLARTAVLAEPRVETLLEISPAGIKEARAANVELVRASQKWWQLLLNPVLIVTVMTLPLVYMFVYGLVPLLSKVSSDVISQTMGTIIGLVLGGIMGFWMGQTYNQTNKRSTDTATNTGG